MARTGASRRSKTRPIFPPEVTTTRVRWVDRGDRAFIERRTISATSARRVETRPGARLTRRPPAEADPTFGVSLLASSRGEVASTSPLAAGGRPVLDCPRRGASPGKVPSLPSGRRRFRNRTSQGAAGRPSSIRTQLDDCGASPPPQPRGRVADRGVMREQQYLGHVREIGEEIEDGLRPAVVTWTRRSSAMNGSGSAAAQ